MCAKKKDIDWRRAEFAIASSEEAHWPRHRTAEVVLAGRSNVGKSSLLNALTGRKQLARVSGAPGRTRQIIFFKVTDAFFLVDLPGYGFAKRSKSERARWGAQIERYFETRENVRLVVVLVDARTGPTELDDQLLDYLHSLEAPVQIVFTKSDKLKPSRRKVEERELRAKLPPAFSKNALFVSSATGDGVDALRARIAEFARL